MSAPCRLAVMASHPVQYFTPLYKRLAVLPGLELDVFFYRDYGVRARFDRQFGRSVRWDTDQLSGYRHRFLFNISPISDTFNPLHAFNPGAFTRLLRGYDAVWMNGYTYPSNWLGLAAASLRNTALLLRSELWLEPTRTSKRLDPLRDRVIRWWVRHADALLYIGEANREAYVAYGAREQQLFFAPYSVDVDAIGLAVRDSAHARRVLRRQWGVPPEAVIALYVGKFTSRKHPEMLLHLLDASARASRLHVVFAGSGPLENALKERVAQLAPGRATFLGFVNQSALPQVYAAADLFVMPSDREPWGLVLNEAMVAGLPPVACDAVGAARDLIVEGITGFTFPVGDWRLMTHHVDRLAEDAALRRRVGDAAMSRAKAYSYDATVAGIVEALRRVGRYARTASEAAPPVRSAGAIPATPGRCGTP